jgi:YVTN family beta-propeller protein
LGVTATIPVGQAPTCAAYDSYKGEVFVSNGQDNTVSVISDSTNTVTATIPVGAYPYGVARDAKNKQISSLKSTENTISTKKP